MVEDYDNVAGNAYDKYNTGNPIARRLMQGFFGSFDKLVTKSEPRRSYEVGCGEGYLSMRLLERGVDASGCDLENSVVEEANEAVRAAGYGERFSVRSVYDIAPESIDADLIVCCEVLEHLPDPEAALGILASQRAENFIFSVPREPLWRAMNFARGKYISDLGNTPGHLQHWSSRGFRAMLEERFDIVDMLQPVPWTMVRCQRRH